MVGISTLQWLNPHPNGAATSGLLFERFGTWIPPFMSSGRGSQPNMLDGLYMPRFSRGFESVGVRAPGHLEPNPFLRIGFHCSETKRMERLKIPQSFSFVVNVGLAYEISVLSPSPDLLTCLSLKYCHGFRRPPCYQHASGSCEPQQ